MEGTTSLTIRSSVGSTSPYHLGFGTITTRSPATALSMRYGPPDHVGTVSRKCSELCPMPSGVPQSNPAAAARWAGYGDGSNRANHSAFVTPSSRVMVTVRSSSLPSTLATSSQPTVNFGLQPVHRSSRPLWWNHVYRKSSTPMGVPSLHTASGRSS